jgi:multisubunit Na+/H+ antiporter MnhG subunit
MNFDIRLPIGSMFAILGVLLFAYGLISGPEIYARSLGININIAWGVVLVVFGAVMLLLSWHAGRGARRDG